MKDALERRLSVDGYDLHTWSNEPNFGYPVHDHPYDKIIVVLKGSISFYLPAENRAVAMKKDETLKIPAGTAHSASVGAQGVTCLEGQKAKGALDET